VAVGAEGDDLGVVYEPADHRGGDDVVAEDLAPAAEAAADELEEQVGGLGFDGDVADFFDDKPRIAARAVQLVPEPAGGWASASWVAHSVAVANSTR
jgi:hypothetical protein